ncbi:hypothetical protein LSTR_LSTR003245 [Laodelphax striatellus]|uniref:Chibby n=1 Tax=Laodelphax striatellus TaxID=195883 RepID=A0A482XRT7_LAOST|nr:hypothetical protein LSTR_LSTR003245 [Laodelphax striatellus]
MPLFSNKFAPKKTPPRKSTTDSWRKSERRDLIQFDADFGPIKLKLGEHECVFEDGEWIPETGLEGERHRENEQLKKQMLRLKEENNLLRLRTEVLLDMLTQTTAEAHIHEKELKQLRQDMRHSMKK